MKRNQARPLAAVLLVLVALMLVAAGCAPAAPPAPTPTKAPAPPAATPTAAAAAVVTPTPAPKPSPTTPPQPVKVRVGVPGVLSDVGVFIGVERGYFKELGLDVEVLPIAAEPQRYASLAANQLEVAGGSAAMSLVNAIDRGIQLRMVADKSSTRKGFEWAVLTVRKDLYDSGQVRKAEDFKGKKVAVTARQTGSEAMAVYILAKGGVKPEDLDFQTMFFADMVAAYANKAIDAAILIEPFLTATLDRGLATVFMSAHEAYPGGIYQSSEFIYSDAFIKNTDAARRFMIGYLKGLRDYNDAFVKNKGKAEVVAILAKNTAVKDLALYDKMKMPYLDPDGKMHLESMMLDLQYFAKQADYKGTLDAKKLVDTQFAEYASQQLGPYK